MSYVLAGYSIKPKNTNWVIKCLFNNKCGYCRKKIHHYRNINYFLICYNQ